MLPQEIAEEERPEAARAARLSKKRQARRIPWGPHGGGSNMKRGPNEQLNKKKKAKKERRKREKMEDPEGEEERKRNRERLMLAAQTRRVVRETVWECMSACENKGKGKGSRKGKGRRAEDERAEGEPAARRPRREARERSQS